MKNLNNTKWAEVAALLKRGGIAVIPTDTIFGIVANAMNESAVQRLYEMRGRNPSKPCIVLCGSLEDLRLLEINVSEEELRMLNKIWPNPVSVIFQCPSDDMSYLHRGSKTLAVRIPKDTALSKFLKETGPLVAPSANPGGMPPAKNIEEAINYFGDSVGVYVGGEVSNEPSTLIKVVQGKPEVLRRGAWEVPKDL